MFKCTMLFRYTQLLLMMDLSNFQIWKKNIHFTTQFKCETDSWGQVHPSPIDQDTFGKFHQRCTMHICQSRSVVPAELNSEDCTAPWNCGICTDEILLLLSVLVQGGARVVWTCCRSLLYIWRMVQELKDSICSQMPAKSNGNLLSVSYTCRTCTDLV